MFLITVQIDHCNDIHTCLLFSAFVDFLATGGVSPFELFLCTLNYSKNLASHSPVPFLEKNLSLILAWSRIIVLLSMMEFLLNNF